ncbi:MAG TPA: hypothetical protein PKW33_19780 [Anaerolineaceae bacterium]|nr:hypothetical protein [Anaerolineaceae bacterium]HPN53846.1 hypothetical protein [Anaerolineaceae bacterium]
MKIIQPIFLFCLTLLAMICTGCSSLFVFPETTSKYTPAPSRTPQAACTPVPDTMPVPCLQEAGCAMIYSDAGELNLTVSDLREPVQMIKNSRRLDEFVLPPCTSASSASTRIFSNENGLTISLGVLNMDTRQSARDIMAERCVSIPTRLQNEMPEVRVSEMKQLRFGDESLMLSGSEDKMGSIHMLIFRQANIYVSIVVVGQGVSLEPAVEIMRAIEKKIQQAQASAWIN